MKNLRETALEHGYFVDWAHLMRMSATSGRENSVGGRWPARSISRTLVPLGAILWSGPCGQVLLLTTAAHVLHQAVCSNLRMVTPMSLATSNWSKIFCAS